MKTIVTILCCCWISLTLSAQVGSTGIYMSADDYIAGKLTLSTGCNTEKSKIKINSGLNSKYVTIIHQGKKYRFDKTEIFGYRECPQTEYRFFKGDEYQIVNKKTLYLYAQRQIETLNKSSNIEVRYFFSVEMMSAIMPLTVAEIKKSFPGNHHLRDLLDGRIHSDSELASYNRHEKNFEIIHLLEESYQENK